MNMDRIHEVAKKVDALTLRERVFVLAAALISFKLPEVPAETIPHASGKPASTA